MKIFTTDIQVLIYNGVQTDTRLYIFWTNSEYFLKMFPMSNSQAHVKCGLCAGRFLPPLYDTFTSELQHHPSFLWLKPGVSRIL